MQMQTLGMPAIDGRSMPPGPAELSPAARRILGFVEAWLESEGSPVSPTVLEPLFATDAPGAMVRALAELCTRNVLRRVDGWHYVLR